MKIHEREGRKVIAVCDRELIGTVLDDGTGYMDLDRYRDFYVGDIVDEERVRKEFSLFSSLNIVGKRSVGIALSAGLADEEDIMYINKTPYIQVYKI